DAAQAGVEAAGPTRRAGPADDLSAIVCGGGQRGAPGVQGLVAGVDGESEAPERLLVGGVVPGRGLRAGVPQGSSSSGPRGGRDPQAPGSDLSRGTPWHGRDRHAVCSRLVWSLCGTLFAGPWAGLVRPEVRGRDGPVGPWQEGRPRPRSARPRGKRGGACG